jgi:hypothetical protein
MFWKKKVKSDLQVVMEFMSQQNAQQVELMGKMVEGVSQQAKVMQEYFKIFTEAPKPEVRQMTDVDEVALETKMRTKRLTDDTQVMRQMPVGNVEWAQQMNDFFADLKK